jgi:Fic family protein
MSSSWKTIEADPVSSFLTARQAKTEGYGPSSSARSSPGSSDSSQDLAALLRALEPFREGLDVVELANKLKLSLNEVSPLLNQAVSMGVLTTKTQGDHPVFILTDLGRKAFDLGLVT